MQKQLSSHAHIIAISKKKHFLILWKVSKENLNPNYIMTYEKALHTQYTKEYYQYHCPYPSGGCACTAEPTLTGGAMRQLLLFIAFEKSSKKRA